MSETAANDQAEKPMLGTLLHEGVYRIVMQRPDRMNSLSSEMMAALSAELDEAAQNPAVRVILLGAEGKVFCAGHDLKELTAARAEADGGKATYERIMGQCSELIQQIVRLPKPVIAVVTGVATAAGCQLVASCDLAIATDTATFCTPGVNIGLFCSTPMVALSRNVAPKHAMEMLLTGESIDASTAKEFGLINRIVPPAPMMVLGDRLRSEQVMVNLLRNAIDATKAVSAPQVDIILSAGETVTLTVRDNGPGIEDLDALFEPFYTTKQPGDGVGLGLAISSGIVNDLGGRLTARNGQAGGAVFEMQLPALDDDADADKTKITAAQ